MAEQLGFREATSFALGGIIGGGIFAVLGVVVAVAGPTAWIAYLLAGVVVLATAHAYVALNAASPRRGGSVTFIETYLDRPTLAGMVGWTLLVGYVGTVAMYGYAFGAYFGAIFGLEAVFGVPGRPVLSVAVVAAFITVNLLGVRESGLIEDLLVAVKLVIVAAFAVFGTAAALGELEFGVAQTVTNPVGPVVAAGIAFVSFEGWQLLFYDQDAIADVESTLPRAVYLSVPVATLAYVAVAFVTVNLVPIETVIAHPDLALAEAAAVVAGRVGYVAVGVAAVASTASAINATLFSTALFADHLGRDDLLPTEGSTGSGVPTRALLVIGVVTMAFTAVGSLTAITEFASLAFIVVFGVVDAIAVMHRSQIPVRPGVAGLGLVGTAAFLPVFVWHLYTAEPRVFQAVATIAVVLGVVEGLYFKRSAASEGLAGIRKRL